MATYDFGITSAEVSSQLAFTTLSGSSDPTSTNVDGLIVRFSAEVATYLKSKGITPSVITTADYDEVYQLARQKIIARVACEWRMINSGGQVSDYDNLVVEEWREYLGALNNLPELVAPELGSGVGFRTTMNTTTTRRFWPPSTSFN